MRTAAIRTGLETLYFSGAHQLLRPFVGGVGAILMLHHVRPASRHAFKPNQLLEVTPEFLARVIAFLRRSDFDIVSLDEMHRRMVEGDFKRRFVCLTFDDGYRDNQQWAYPILKANDVPFAVYLPTSFPDRLGELWWLALETVIARNDRIGLQIDGENRYFDCTSVADKISLFDHLYQWLRGRKTEEELRAVIRDLCARYQVDNSSLCDELCLTWDEVRKLAADPLVTIGAHTVNHVILTKVSERTVRSEMDMSRRVIESALGVRPQHFASPVGDRTAAGPREFQIAAELGFKTAVTTRPGVLFAGHREHLTALPRISLNGNFQQLRYVQVLLSGAATAVWNGMRRLDLN